MKHLKTTFFLREKRKNKNGETPIYVRLNLNGQTKRFASGIYVFANMWDSSLCEVLEKHKCSDDINVSIDVVRHQKNCYLIIIIKLLMIIT
jgi:hypothetical protein